MLGWNLDLDYIRLIFTQWLSGQVYWLGAVQLRLRSHFVRELKCPGLVVTDCCGGSDRWFSFNF